MTTARSRNTLYRKTFFRHCCAPWISHTKIVCKECIVHPDSLLVAAKNASNHVSPSEGEDSLPVVNPRQSQRVTGQAHALHRQDAAPLAGSRPRRRVSANERRASRVRFGGEAPKAGRPRHVIDARIDRRTPLLSSGAEVFGHLDGDHLTADRRRAVDEHRRVDDHLATVDLAHPSANQ